jgi:hypothetical protein
MAVPRISVDEVRMHMSEADVGSAGPLPRQALAAAMKSLEAEREPPPGTLMSRLRQSASSASSEPDPIVARAERLANLKRAIPRDRDRKALELIVAAGTDGIETVKVASKLKMQSRSMCSVIAAIRRGALSIGIEPDEAVTTVRGAARRGSVLRSRLGFDATDPSMSSVMLVRDAIRTTTSRRIFDAVVEAGDEGIKISELMAKAGLPKGATIGPILHAIHMAAKRAKVQPEAAVVSKPHKDGTRLRSEIACERKDDSQPKRPSASAKVRAEQNSASSPLTHKEAKLMRLLGDEPKTVETLSTLTGVGLVTVSRVIKNLVDRGLAKNNPGRGYTKRAK